MKSGITESMKTAISIEDSLMERADTAARELGLSRSRLIADALNDYLLRRKRELILDQLNRAYADEPTKSERALVRKLRTKFRITDKW